MRTKINSGWIAHLYMTVTIDSKLMITKLIVYILIHPLIINSFIKIEIIYFTL